MLFDADTCDLKCFDDTAYDACIVGAGPAGISLALRLAKRGWKVGLFEGGGLEATAESQEIYDGDMAGTEYVPLDVTRLRYFGGTSNHWTGYSRPLDAIDFEPLPHYPAKAWPIRRADLDPYAAETADILDVQPLGPVFDVFKANDGPFVPFQFGRSAPTRFGPKYKDALAAAPNVHLFLNANLVDVDLTDNRRNIETATFRSFARPQPFSVRARCFVLCMGGLENPRFLLNANRQVAGGIGNDNDLVGRFFCEHLHFTVGSLLWSPEVQSEYPMNFFYRPTRQFLIDHRINAFCLRMQRGLLHGPDNAFFSDLRAAICQADFLVRIAGMIRHKDFQCFDATVRCMGEQRVNPDSRVTLSDKTDRFGKRRIKLNWNLLDVDKETMRVAALEYGKQLARANVGRIKLADWLLDRKASLPTLSEGEEVAGNHHMCTTRMSDDPKQGVVNRNCRLHAVDNFYLGGSSVFASAGFSNPTFTIVQLALRLGDHLDARLKSAAAFRAPASGTLAHQNA